MIYVSIALDPTVGLVNYGSHQNSGWCSSCYLTGLIYMTKIMLRQFFCYFGLTCMIILLSLLWYFSIWYLLYACSIVAFGSGLFKICNQNLSLLNVQRFVIHNTMSKSIESYYQESGRAGRDDHPAVCIALYQKKDFSRVVCMLRNGLKYKKESFKTAMTQAQKMQQYCELKVSNCTLFHWLLHSLSLFLKKRFSLFGYRQSSLLVQRCFILKNAFEFCRLTVGDKPYSITLESLLTGKPANMVLILVITVSRLPREDLHVNLCMLLRYDTIQYQFNLPSCWGHISVYCPHHIPHGSIKDCFILDFLTRHKNRLSYWIMPLLKV